MEQSWNENLFWQTTWNSFSRCFFLSEILFLIRNICLKKFFGLKTVPIWKIVHLKIHIDFMKNLRKKLKIQFKTANRLFVTEIDINFTLFDTERSSCNSVPFCNLQAIKLLINYQQIHIWKQWFVKEWLWFLTVQLKHVNNNQIANVNCKKKRTTARKKMYLD